MPVDVLIPVLSYPDIGEAIAWLTAAFGFRERWRAGDHRAQLAVGPTAAIALTRRGGPLEGEALDHVMVRVGDVDAHAAAARAHGARIVAEPTDYPYGERQYTVLDHVGRSWVFSQTIADVAPEAWGGSGGGSA